jgi:hypothetical protein
VISALLAAALLLTETAPASAPAPRVEAPASDSAATRSSAANDKTVVKDAKVTRVCHYEEISGSRIPKKVCN